MGEADGGVGLVDMLPASPRRPIGVGAHIRRVDVDHDGVVDHRIDPDRGEAGMPLGRRVEGRDPHQPVHAGLGLQPAVGVRPLDLDGRRLDPGLLPRGFLQEVDGHAMGVGPAGVHPKQHAGPVAGLRAAGAGVHFQKSVISVGLSGQQGLKLRPGGSLPDGLQLATRLLEAGLVILLIGEFSVADSVAKIPLQADHRLDRGRKARALPAYGLCFIGTVPEGRILDPGVQFMQFAEGDIPVKVAS